FLYTGEIDIDPVWQVPSAHCILSDRTAFKPVLAHVRHRGHLPRCERRGLRPARNHHRPSAGTRPHQFETDHPDCTDIRFDIRICPAVCQYQSFRAYRRSCLGCVARGRVQSEEIWFKMVLWVICDAYYTGSNFLVCHDIEGFKPAL